MRRILTICGLAMSVLALALPGAGHAAESLSFTMIATGTSSGVREAANLIIRDAADWTVWWRRHVGASMRQRPAVDFDREMVIGIFAGESRIPRRVSIVRIVPEAGSLVVWYRQADTRPLPDGEGVAPSAPFVIVRLPRSSLPVRFALVKTPQVVRPP